jgi:CDP-paratose 2-epimerase
VHYIHGDLRNESDLERLPKFDWIIDCAALVSVMSGVDGKSSSRQLVENNLLSTVNLLEICRRDTCGLILLSTSRVYSIATLKQIALDVIEDAFHPKSANPSQSISPRGIQEPFSTAAPTSLYAASKLASERLAQEYSARS